ncbi:MAG: hypothetical protein MZU84_02545 [Sphingobacterium sp.]|nr:hypothetical protein [Sphingobacterium sp.]
MQDGAPPLERQLGDHGLDARRLGTDHGLDPGRPVETGVCLDIEHQRRDRLDALGPTRSGGDGRRQPGRSLLGADLDGSQSPGEHRPTQTPGVRNRLVGGADKGHVQPRVSGIRFRIRRLAAGDVIGRTGTERIWIARSRGRRFGRLRSQGHRSASQRQRDQP